MLDKISYNIHFFCINYLLLGLCLRVTFFRRSNIRRDVPCNNAKGFSNFVGYNGVIGKEL
jgi:hypothetical protein